MIKIFLREIEHSPKRSQQLMQSSKGDADKAERFGFCVGEPGKSKQEGYKWTITQKGKDFLLGKYEIYIPYYFSKKGRARGSTQKVKATWLLSLPTTFV